MIRPFLPMAAALMAPLLLPTDAEAEQRPMDDGKSDFSTVTSRTKAAALARQGKLVKILIFPAELGGENVAENITYVPPEAAQAQNLIIGTLQRFTAKGSINYMTATPEYRGNSFVPIRIVYRAIKTGKKGSFEPTIHIW